MYKAQVFFHLKFIKTLLLNTSINRNFKEIFTWKINWKYFLIILVLFCLVIKIERKRTFSQKLLHP